MGSSTLLAVAVLLASAACAVASTDGQTLKGYKFGSDAQKYINWAKDACDINDLLSGSSPDFNKAQDVYKNSNPKNGAKRTGYTQSLSTLATYQFTGEKHWDMYGKWFNDATWLDSFMQEAFKGSGDFVQAGTEGRAQGIKKTATSGILYQMVLHELDVAGQDMTQGKYGDKDGAPHTLDEAFAVYAGTACGPWANADKYAPLFGTIKDCKTNSSIINDQIVNHFINGRAAAKKQDRAGVQDAVDGIIRGIVATHIQAVLKYTKEMDDELAANASPVEAQAEGYTYYRTIAPLIAEADPQVAKDLYKLLDLPITPKKTIQYYNTAKTLMESTYAKLGISANMIGTFGAQSSTNSCPKVSSAAGISSALAVAGAVVGAVAMLL